MRRYRLILPAIIALAFVLGLTDQAHADPIKLGFENQQFASDDVSSSVLMAKALGTSTTTTSIEFLDDGDAGAESDIVQPEEPPIEPFGEYQDRIKLGLYATFAAWSEDTLIDDRAFVGVSLVYEVPGLVQIRFVDIGYGRFENDARIVGGEGSDLEGNIWHFSLWVGLTNNELSGEDWAFWGGFGGGAFLLQDFTRTIGGVQVEPSDIWLVHWGLFLEFTKDINEVVEFNIFTRANFIFGAFIDEDDVQQTFGEFIDDDSFTQKSALVYEIGASIHFRF